MFARSKCVFAYRIIRHWYFKIPRFQGLLHLCVSRAATRRVFTLRLGYIGCVGSFSGGIRNTRFSWGEHMKIDMRD